MKRPANQAWSQAALAVACVAVLSIRLDQYGASEFSGGWLTGRLFRMADVCLLVFAGAIIVTFFHPRVAAALLLVASVLAEPFYLYLLIPGAYRSIFGGEYSVAPHSAFVWNSWAAIGLMLSLGAIVFSIHILRQRIANPAT